MQQSHGYIMSVSRKRIMIVILIVIFTICPTSNAFTNSIMGKYNLFIPPNSGKSPFHQALHYSSNDEFQSINATKAFYMEGTTKKIYNNNSKTSKVPFRPNFFEVVQIAIVGLSIVGKMPILNSLLVFLMGKGLFLGGLILMTRARMDLVQNNPKKDKLITTGVFSKVRHPFYTGNLMILLGLAGMSSSSSSSSLLVTNKAPIRIVLTILSFILLERKSQREEQELATKFDTDYEIYKIMVKGKFIPHNWVQTVFDQ